MKVLLAEDDDSIRSIAKLVLEQFGGHSVTTAADGGEAFKLGHDGNFDLVILDEMMPVMNGLSVSQKLRESWVSNPPGPPIIFLSAKSRESDVDAFLKSGAGFISKPFDPRTLCNQIEDVLKKTGAKSPPGSDSK